MIYTGHKRVQCTGEVYLRTEQKRPDRGIEIKVTMRYDVPNLYYLMSMVTNVAKMEDTAHKEGAILSSKWTDTLCTVIQRNG